MGLFGREKPDSDLIRNVSDYFQLYGIPGSQANKMAAEGVASARRKCEAAGVGEAAWKVDSILEQERSGTLAGPLRETLARCRADGCRDSDIRWWYSMPVLEQEVWQSVFNALNLSYLTAIMNQESKPQLSNDELFAIATKRFKATCTSFGNPTKPDDPHDLLPIPLRVRVMTWIGAQAPSRLAEAAKFGTMNAFIRHMIKMGAI